MGAQAIALDVLGLRVALSSSTADVREAYTALFEPFLAVPAAAPDVRLGLDPVDGGWQLWVDDAGRGFRTEWRELLPIVVTEINRRAVDQMAWFGAHAGVVAVGRAVVAFPGESGVGKSTAVAACVAAGATYVSDEALVLTPEGRVVPYPRPICLSPGMASRLGMTGIGDTEEVALAVADVPVLSTGETASLEHVVLLNRVAGAAARLTELPRADTAIHLLRNSFNHYRDPAGALRVTTAVARRARCWELTYDGPEDVPASVRGLARPSMPE